MVALDDRHARDLPLHRMRRAPGCPECDVIVAFNAFVRALSLKESG